MLFFTQKVLRREPGNWTFVMVTDRRELDDQLYGDFKDAGVVEGHLQADVLGGSAAAARRGPPLRLHADPQVPARAGGGDAGLLRSQDVIVITDEAHRSQYSALALNMRRALPNAGFLGFTGTPLIKGEEERTREVFGDYVSTYNFRDSIEDGATVPLFYENRIPELQIINESFDEELTGILEAAELDEAQERALSRRFATEYQLITRPERLRRIAADLVRHFVGRGFLGKAMFVAIDKATAVRMYDLVAEEWELHLAELRERAERLPELERIGVDEQIAFMEETDMAVVVSQSQNEIAEMREAGLDIAPHRKRMLKEDLDERFKDPDDPFRLVFVCAMWMTGFDVPSCSTIYLDRPMRNHTLMQTIARANRVFPDKENGLIVDYVGVFRHLEEALAVYAAARDGERAAEIIRDKSALVEELEEEIGELMSSASAGTSTSMPSRGPRASSSSPCATPRSRALLVDDVTRRAYLERSDRGAAAVRRDPARPRRDRPHPGRGGGPQPRRDDPLARPGSRSLPRLRSGSGPARPLGRGGGVRDPRRGGCGGRRLADRPQRDRLRCPGRATRGQEALLRAAHHRPARDEGRGGGAEESQPAGSGRAAAAADRRVQRRQPQRRRDAASSPGAVAPALRGGAADRSRGAVGARAGRVRPADQAGPGADRGGARRGEAGRAQADGAHPGAAGPGLAPQGADARGGPQPGQGHPRGASRDAYEPEVWERKAEHRLQPHLRQLLRRWGQRLRAFRAGRRRGCPTAFGAGLRRRRRSMWTVSRRRCWRGSRATPRSPRWWPSSSAARRRSSPCRARS